MTRKALIAKSLDAGPLKLGQLYWVASILEPGYFGNSSVPILPVLHVDEGTSIPHYNVDTRFLTQRQYRDYIQPNQHVAKL